MELHNMACEYNDFLSDPLYPKIKIVLNAAIFKSQVLSIEQSFVIIQLKIVTRRHLDTQLA